MSSNNKFITNTSLTHHHHHHHHRNSTTSWSIIGKTCLITGANRGVGYYTALELAKRGARRVILACRNVEAAKQAIVTMRQQLDYNNTGGGGGDQTLFAAVHLDLASLTSVRQCAEIILQNEPNLHVLINNAGVQVRDDGNKRSITQDGYELFFQTNYLGHFLLTNLLLPLMERSAPASRIVVVASDCYLFCSPGGLGIDDLNLTNPGYYSSFRAYCQSKLANILFVRQLHRRLNGGSINPCITTNRPVSVFALHPGFARPNRHQQQQQQPVPSSSSSSSSSPSSSSAAASGLPFNQIVAEHFAASLVYCACEPGLESMYSGCYFGESTMPGSIDNNNNNKGVHVLDIAKDDVKAERLWQLSEEMLTAATSSSTAIIINDDNNNRMMMMRSRQSSSSDYVSPTPP